MRALHLDEDWRFLCQFFPSNLDELAKSTGAVKRWRNVRDGEELLRLCLAYVVGDFSLRTTAGWATRSYWLQIKDTSVLHRLRNAAPFLERVLAHLLNHRVGAEGARASVVRLVDATCLSIPGSVGSDWRIHAVYEPLRGRLVSVEVTDFTGGERLGIHRFESGDVVVGDRGLAHARGIHEVHEREAFVLLRMHWQNIKLLSPEGQSLDIQGILQRADQGITGTDVSVPLKGKTAVPARLLVRPLPRDLAEQARAQKRRTASKKGRKPSTLGIQLAGYFTLLTTIPEEFAPDPAVMEYYRIRWQIELFFKRCKSLLNLDSLRAVDPDLVRTYCVAKLIQIALAELLASEGESFSPWGFPSERWPADEFLASDAHASS